MVVSSDAVVPIERRTIAIAAVMIRFLRLIFATSIRLEVDHPLDTEPGQIAELDIRLVGDFQLVVVNDTELRGDGHVLRWRPDTLDVIDPGVLFQLRRLRSHRPPYSLPHDATSKSCCRELETENELGSMYSDLQRYP